MHSFNEMWNLITECDSEPQFSNMAEYVHSHRNEYTSDEYSKLERAINDREKYFEPAQCQFVREIVISYHYGNDMVGSLSYSGRKAAGYCMDAKEAKIPFREYINRLARAVPGFFTWKLVRAAPHRAVSLAETGEMKETGAGAGLIRRMRESMEENEVNVDIAALIVQLRAAIDELSEAVAGNNAETSKLREKINSYYHEVDMHEPPPEKEKPKYITRVLASYQYHWVLANIRKLNLPAQFRKLARGEYEISIQTLSPEDEKRATAFIEEAENLPEPARKRELNPDPPGTDEILDQLCKNYEKAAKMKCGLSRTGALHTLAVELAEYADARNIDYRDIFDPYSIDLFAKPGKIYTAEQADEAFKNAISGFDDKALAEDYEAALEGCTGPEISDAITDYDALSAVESKYLLPEKLKVKKDEAINTLKECNYYPNRLDGAREEAMGWGEQYGMDYQEGVKAAIKKYIGEINESNGKDRR